MPLTPGTRLGVYESPRDRRRRNGASVSGDGHDAGPPGRDRVPAGRFRPDPERLARFEREAKTLASLNHPNIAAIYGFEKSGGLRALVMELVEGDDLSQRIAAGRDSAR